MGVHLVFYVKHISGANDNHSNLILNTSKSLLTSELVNLCSEL